MTGNYGEGPLTYTRSLGGLAPARPVNEDGAGEVEDVDEVEMQHRECEIFELVMSC